MREPKMTDSPRPQGSTAPSRIKVRRRSLDHFRLFRNILVGARRLVYVHFWKMDIHPTVQFSLSAKFDRTFPTGVHVGANSYVAFDARILTHDMIRGLNAHTRIGENCFIGGRSLILPGIEIGNNSVVGAGSVVTKNVPPYTLVAGNPARVLRTGINVGTFGRFLTADETVSTPVEAGLT